MNSAWVNAGERLLLTLWVGSLWAIGYLAAPTLFAVLDDRALAGTLAGHMFRAVSIITIVACIALLLLMTVRDGWRALRGWRALVLGSAAAITAVSLFVLQPAIHELRAQGFAPGTEQAAQFGKMHGLSSALYLIVSVLGLSLVAAGPRSVSLQGVSRSSENLGGP